uniref:DUF834 domain-containing protein n=1 Tax=Oryza barthii TaxID=65489 RepID=A0A0D3HSJ9_9ORYZ
MAGSPAREEEGVSAAVGGNHAVTEERPAPVSTAVAAARLYDGSSEAALGGSGAAVIEGTGECGEKRKKREEDTG